MNHPLRLLQFAGVLHFAILLASALTPKALDWKQALAPLPPLLRRMFWVYGVFIVLTIIGFGTLTLIYAEAFVAGEPLARGLAAFIALFWAARLVVQFFVFDARPYLTHPLLTMGYHALTVAFVILVAIYGATALALF